MSFTPVVVVAVAVAAVIMAAAIADIVMLGRERFVAAGQRQLVWILLTLCIGPLGVLLYVAAVRAQVAHPERYAELDADAQSPDARIPLGDAPRGAAEPDGR